MAKIAIARTIMDDPSVRIYHSRYQLTDASVVVAEKGTHPSPEQCEEDPRGAGIVESFLDIPGVAGVQAHAYYIAVIKAQMYKWEEVEPFILRLMSSFNLDLEDSLLSVPEPLRLPEDFIPDDEPPCE